MRSVLSHLRPTAMPPFVDFRSVKERFSVVDALIRYGFFDHMDELDNGQLRGPCPVHSTTKTGTSFKVTTSGQGFRCFGCGAKGNVLDLVAAVEQLTPHAAAVRIHEWLDGASAPSVSSEETEELDAVLPSVIYEEHLGARLPIYTTRLVCETTLDVQDFLQCKCPPDVVPFLQRYYAEHDREEFVALIFDTAMQCTGLVSVSIGGRNASIVEPAQVFKAAILGHADSLILAHNHPSGNPEPSRNDIAITKQLCEAGEMMGVPIRDHLVITRRSFTSLAERGLM